MALYTATVGERYWGYRMQPGTHIHQARLLAAVAARPCCDAADILPILHDCIWLDAPVHDALLALADSPNVAHAAARVQPGLQEAFAATGYG